MIHRRLLLVLGIPASLLRPHCMLAQELVLPTMASCPGASVSTADWKTVHAAGFVVSAPRDLERDSAQHLFAPLHGRYSIDWWAGMDGWDSLAHVLAPHQQTVARCGFHLRECIGVVAQLTTPDVPGVLYLIAYLPEPSVLVGIRTTQPADTAIFFSMIPTMVPARGNMCGAG